MNLPNNSLGEKGGGIMFTSRAILINDKIKFIDDLPFSKSETEYFVLVTFISNDINSTIIGDINNDNTVNEKYQPISLRKFRIFDSGLSKRELEILQLLQQGLTNEEIAENLELGNGTVRNYTSSIYMKLKVPNRTSAVSKATELGLLE
jgi:DNA-binding NarL/FixJ family response regulator